MDAEYVSHHYEFLQSNSGHNRRISHEPRIGRWFNRHCRAKFARFQRSHAAALIVMLLVITRKRLHRHLIDLGTRNRYPYAEGFGVTVKALIVTLLLTMIWPLLLASLGKRLNVAQDTGKFANALGKELIRTAWFLLFFFGFCVLCCRDWVAVEQFRWAAAIVDLLRRNLRWLLVVTVSGVLLTATLNAQSNELRSNHLARLAYLVSMAALGIFFQRVLNFKTSLFAASIARRATRVERQSPNNKKVTATTRRNVITSVPSTSCTDAGPRVSCRVVSCRTEFCTPCQRKPFRHTIQLGIDLLGDGERICAGWLINRD